jgi:hypothetical protein
MPMRAQIKIHRKTNDVCPFSMIGCINDLRDVQEAVSELSYTPVFDVPTVF